MKTIGVLVICITMILASCQVEAPKKGDLTQESAAQIPTAEATQKLPMYVMVHGDLYKSTGRESKLTARCGTMDGEISSTVATSEKPKKENESNFGTGYSYQYTEKDVIEVCINQHWIIFERENHK